MLNAEAHLRKRETTIGKCFSVQLFEPMLCGKEEVPLLPGAVLKFLEDTNYPNLGQNSDEVKNYLKIALDVSNGTYH